MRILCAPDSFKGTLTATEAAEAMREGIRRADPSINVDLCPVADGGEGTVEALVRATGGTFHETPVTGPLQGKVVARWGVLGDRVTAVIEAASAAGLPLVPEGQRDPTRTTTFGVGELIAGALDAGCQKIIVGVGGSATCDGGCGMAQALGVLFLNQDGRAIEHPITGGDLGSIGSVNMDHLRADLLNIEIITACDVTNPLCGQNGAANIYAPQKGATPKQVRELDAGLNHLASLLKDVGDVNTPGMGAAGGLGFGLSAFAGAKLQRGIDLVLDTLGFDERLTHADLVLTGEGRLDEQTISFGKAIAGVAKRAQQRGVSVRAIVGSVADDPSLESGRILPLEMIHTLTQAAGSEAEALKKARFWLETVAETIARSL